MALAPHFHLPYINPHGARPPDHAKRHGQPEKARHRDKAHRRPGRQVYPRSINGYFQRWCWAFIWLTQLVFYGLCWLPWNGRQAVLFDLDTRRFYLFDLVLWPPDAIYLAILLALSALALFLFFAVAGRLWCGYTCPQTVYTEVSLWLEKLAEGERPKRMKLDAAPWSVHKLAVKTAKHTLWIALALWTGLTFVGYFTPIRDLTHGIVERSLGPWELFWVLFYGAAIYGNAGFMHEHMCKYICPYAQSLYAIRYWPLLSRARLDGKPG